MKFKRRVFLEKGRLDIAPLIDVVFLLLIFFMLTSSFIFQPGIKINLPKALTSEVIQRENLIIVITDESAIYISERQIDSEELSSRLKIAAQESKQILIKADRKASLGRVVEVWDMCRAEGIQKINIATTQKR
ncbi:MAG: biopolymer transporter ExbD [Candidatus Omnitrophica bacterium]|nr:biopolymer transporter ExbD [Candidatus Omnitrophota bacterium]